MSTHSQQQSDRTKPRSKDRFRDWSQIKLRVQPTLRDFVRDSGKPYDEPDANNATKLYHPSDYPDSGLSEERWKRLDGYNSGITNLKWSNSPYITYQLNRHHILALTSQLELSRRQRRRVYNRFMQLELGKWGVSANLIAFCVCAVTIHTDSTYREYHPNQDSENKDEIFVRVRDSLGLRKGSVRKFYSKYENYISNSSNGNFNYLEFQKRLTNKEGI